MNAMSPITRDTTAWDDAVRALNEWRGHWIHLFARGEVAVSETLVALAAVKGRGADVRLCPLSGQRLQDLRTALAAGSFEGVGDEAARALGAFCEHTDLRPFLCHGKATPWLGRSGRWGVELELLTFRTGKPLRLSRFVDEREAEQSLATLSADCRALETALATLRRTIAA